MNSCTVEAINALWSALGAFVTAFLLLRWATKAMRGERGFGDPGPELAVCLALAVGGFGTYWGQQSLRYYVGAGAGYECVYDAGSVVVKR